MAFILVLIGLLLVVSAIRGTQAELGSQVVSDFTGPGNFVYWILALGIVGAVGYVGDLQKFSRAFMALLIIVLLLSNKGFFNQFTKSIQTGTAQPAAKPDEQIVTFNGSSAGGLDLASIGHDATDILSFIGGLG